MENELKYFIHWNGLVVYPYLRNLWLIIPPYVIWHIWKERNNRIFKEQANTNVGVAQQLIRLVKECNGICCWKPHPPPLNPLGGLDMKWASTWNVESIMAQFDNSKVLARNKTTWLPPHPSWFKLKLDNSAMMGSTTIGGILRNSTKNMVVTYAGNYGGSNNEVEAMALLWG